MQENTATKNKMTRQSEWQKKRREAGLCTICGRRKLAGKWRCRACKAQNLAGKTAENAP